MIYSGKCSTFGGPDDIGVKTDEDLSLVSGHDLDEWFFDRVFEPATAWKKFWGLARNLNPSAFYCALRFNFASYAGKPGEILPGVSREDARRAIYKITAKSGRCVFVQAVDWGPNPDTGRLVDLSPGAAAAIMVNTDDEVTVQPILATT